MFNKHWCNTWKNTTDIGAARITSQLPLYRLPHKHYYVLLQKAIKQIMHGASQIFPMGIGNVGHFPQGKPAMRVSLHSLLLILEGNPFSNVNMN